MKKEAKEIKIEKLEKKIERVEMFITDTPSAILKIIAEILVEILRYS